MTARGHMLLTGPVVFMPLIGLHNAYPMLIENTMGINNETTFMAFFYGVLIGSLLPDIDEPNSSIGRKTIGISNIINVFFGHRGITHSILFIALIAIAMLFVANNEMKLMIAGLVAGVIAHIIGDALTKERLYNVFYPARMQFSLLPEGMRFHVNGLIENLFVIPLLIVLNLLLTIPFMNEFSHIGMFDIASKTARFVGGLF